MSSLDQKRATFRRLHESGCFVIPNPWDVGSALYLESLGFVALATTSAGFAWSRGRADNQVSVEEVLRHLEEVASAVAIPVNADFEGGFAVEPSAVAANVRRAVSTGISGLSIEDSGGDMSEPLFEFGLAVERVKAASEAVSGTGVILTARTEGLRTARPDFDEILRRLIAFSRAGADCLYAPGIKTAEHVEAAVKAVAPKPVNVLVGSNHTTVARLESLGVRRISVGGGLARSAWAGFMAAAREIAEGGTFNGLAAAAPFDQVDGVFKENAGRT